MGIETKETLEHIYDTDLIAEAVYYIEQGYRSRLSERYSREVVSRIVETADKVLSTVIKKRMTAEVDNKETEEEARAYFGDEFIKQFEDIRKKLAEQDMTLYIHGTDIEIANNAMENGFEAKNPSITSTAVAQESYENAPEYQEFSKFMNWPHQDYKGFVLLAIPNECRDTQGNAKPLWEYRPVPEGTELTTLTRQFVIRPEFIVGTLDATEKKIKENPLYTNIHNYDGLLLDDSVLRLPEIQPKKEETEILDNIIEDNDSVTKVIDENDVECQKEKLEDEIETLVDIIYEFYTPILVYKETGTRILEIDVEEMTYFKTVDAKKLEKDKAFVQEALKKLKEIIPTLETREIDDKGIDDFISDVRMSEFGSFTEKIKMLQIVEAKGKDFEWGNEEIHNEKDFEWGDEKIHNGYDINEWD